MQKYLDFFKYHNYKKFLRHLRDNYEVIPVCNWNNKNNVIILGHDVDHNVMSAYKLSHIEKQCGVMSTYFFMVSSFMYNVLSIENKELIKRMSIMGYDIGLHFNPNIYNTKNEKEIEKIARYEADILKFIIKKDVKSINIHEPIDGIIPIINGFNNAYVNSENYISDSWMNFKGKNILTFVEKSKSSTIVLSLHPCYYYE